LEPVGFARELAPGGILRAAINLGNPILAARDPQSGELSGVSVDLARALASRVGLPLRLVTYRSAGEVVDAAALDAWDVAFVALDPKRAETLAQTAPYLTIEGAYLVRQNSLIHSNEDVDRDAIRIAVGAKSAYDLYLSRTLQHARLVRVPSSPEVTERFLAEGLDVAAGVRQQLQADAARIPGLRLLPGHFMEIEQALATPREHRASMKELNAFLSEYRRSGFLERSLAIHHIEGAEVVP
jgi:polar amino acid transport system substrate-binding protein